MPGAPSSGSTRVRWVAWVALVTAAAFQGFAQRHSMTPDGVAYLDLSDALLHGDWRGFINLYWSPLYPALIGVARMIAHPSAYWEFAAVHAVNLALFVASLAAFEWFLAALADVSSDWPLSRHHWWTAGAYVLFGTVSLTMTTLELPTPDLLVTAAALAAFAAMLRAHAGIRATRNGVMLGLVLGVGALAKSFFVPWGVVCLAVFAIATKRLGRRPLVAALAAWAMIVGPWSVTMSHEAGRPSFGEAGRLTYVWYVNSEFSPTSGSAPPSASARGPNSVFPGVAATGDAPGTNPIWLDPARWYAGLQAHFTIREQLENVRIAANYYVRNLAPFVLLVATMLGITAPADWRTLWRRGWVVFVPVIAALVAYALVIVTARYVAGFLIAAIAMFCAALPWPVRLRPARVAVGILIVFLMETLAANAAPTLAVLVAGMSGVLVTCAMGRTKTAYALLVGAVVAVVSLAMLLPAPRAAMLGVGFVVVLATWLSLRRNAQQIAGTPERFRLAFAALIALLLVGRTAQRLWRDAGVVNRPNNSWLIARDLGENGVGPGTRVLLVGPADQAIWARPARLRITADVPSWRVPAFWTLAEQSRDSLLERFADTGAQVAIASLVAGTPVKGWRVIESGGWIRPLTASASR